MPNLDLGTPLSPEEIGSFMLALGFHRINSRKRWKMKLSENFEITDFQLEFENSNANLENFLINYLRSALDSRKKISKKLRFIIALFSSIPPVDEN